MTRAVRAISVDALGTVVQVRGGSVGVQYAAAARKFFLHHWPPEIIGERTTEPPSHSSVISETVLEQVFRPADLEHKFRSVFKKAAAANGARWPACQKTDEQFWTENILRETFDEALSALEKRIATREPQWQVGDNARAKLYRHIYTHFGTSAAWELLPGAASALCKAAERGIKLCCVTNNDARMAAVLRQLAEACPSSQERAAVTKVSECVVCSFDVARLKPDPEGIRLAAARLGVSLAHWLHVGDEDADEKAAADAPCKFVKVEDTRGVHWEDLLPHLL